MRAFVVQAAVLFFVLLAVMAVVFRSAAARDMLRFGRNVAWVYIALIVALAAVRAWQQGF